MTVKHLFPAVEPSLNLDFANSKKLDPRITFTRSSTGTYVDSNGVIKTAAANEARFDYDGATGSSLGLLVEESRTNVLYPSTPDYSGGYGSWTNGSAPLTANAGTAPDGTNTAVLTAWDTVSGGERMYYNTGTPSSVGVTEIHSFFVKAKTPGSGDVFSVRFQGVNWSWLNGSSSTRSFSFSFDTETFSANTGTGYGQVVTKFPDGWYRISIPAINNGTGVWNTYVMIRRNEQAGNWYIWGCQREDGAFPTSYIPTSGSTVTRSADVASMTGTNFSSWYNQTAGSFIATWDQPVNSSNALTIIAEGGSAFDFTIWTYNGLPQFATYLSHINQNNYAQSPSVAIPINTLQTIGGSYDSAGVTAALNGNTPVTSGSSTTINEGATLIRFGARNSGIFYINGHLARFTYYPFRLTDAQLQALTL